MVLYFKSLFLVHYGYQNLKKPALTSLHQESHVAISNVKPDITGYIHGIKLSFLSNLQKILFGSFIQIQYLISSLIFYIYFLIIIIYTKKKI